MPNPIHMGQTAENHVVLEVVHGVKGGCGPGLFDFMRVLPDGSRGSGAFRVPKGHVLVVTDADWQYVHPNGSAFAGRIEILRLFIESLADPSKSGAGGPREGQRAFESTITLSSTGEGGTSESMTTGFVVSSKARICPDVFPGPMGPPFGLQHLILRGYLAPD